MMSDLHFLCDSGSSTVFISFIMMHLNSRAFRCFLHDVHHAYLLLHRALQTLPPTSIPNLEPMPLPSEGIHDQHPQLQPMEAHDDDANLASPEYHPSPVEVDDSASERFFNEVLAQESEATDKEDGPCSAFSPLPRPVRHLSAPEPHELPLPKPKPAVKKPSKRPRTKRSRMNKSPSLPHPSEAATPWTSAELTLLTELKSNTKQRPSWKAVADRLKRSEADVKNQWALYKANSA